MCFLIVGFWVSYCTYSWMLDIELTEYNLLQLKQQEDIRGIILNGTGTQLALLCYVVVHRAPERMVLWLGCMCTPWEFYNATHGCASESSR